MSSLQSYLLSRKYPNFIILETRHFPTLFYHSLSHSSTLDNEGNEASYLCIVIRKTQQLIKNEKLKIEKSSFVRFLVFKISIGKQIFFNF